jgi:branched-chain amino acid transport system permease protein
MNLTTLGVGIASGLGEGSLYALLALSFSLIVASTGYFNFALESVVALGGIGAYYLEQGANMPVAPVVIILCVGGAIAGVLIDLIAHRPLEARADDVAASVLLATIGLSFAVDGGTGVIFGASPRAVPPYVATSPVMLGGVAVAPWYIVSVALMIVTVTAMELVLRRTVIGLSLRAMQADREGIALLGQNVNAATALVFALAGVLAIVVGFLATPLTQASSQTGQTLLIPAFAALALGGFGSFRGAIAGGVLIGLVEGMLPLYVTPAAVNPILLVVIIAVLVARPRGLFASSQFREL